VPPGTISFQDELQGATSFTPSLQTGDFVVRRKDGVAAYQLAVVVDDAAMQITDVLRGADLLSSTARQLTLYDVLGLEKPKWVHVPLMLTESLDRFAKRDAAITLKQLRSNECPPERLVGWLAWTCGLASEGEECRPADLISRFDLSLIPRADTAVAIPNWMIG
jgi:glutamyl-tRNA synthetase